MILLKDDKVILRSVESSDIDTILLWENANNEPLYGIFEEQYSREDVAQFVENQQRYSIAENEQLRLMICSHEGVRLGCIDLAEYDGRKAFVSILIFSSDNRRKRFATSALQILIKYQKFYGGATMDALQTVLDYIKGIIAILKDFFAERGLEYTIPTVDRLVNYYNQHKREELFLSIGEGKITLDDATINFIKGKKGSSWKNFIPFIGKKDEKVEVNIDTDFAKGLNRKKTLVLNEEVLEKCQIATCCNPIPGDDVMGYINSHGELEIHARSCEHATKQKTRFGNNIIEKN